MNKKTTYKDAGVDIAKAENALGSLKERIAASHGKEVLKGVGLFGGFFDLSGHGLEAPVLVSSTDGVGTKLKVAILSHRHDTVGKDLVHHCINDIAVCGAKPLFFLDYFASGALQPDVYTAVVGGLADACRDSGVALVGGETAEMPDFYSPDEYDMCGTIVGIVEKDAIIDGSKIAAGDRLIGVASNGLHTNGYTLARRVLLEDYMLDDQPEGLPHTLADELLRIHTNYYPLISRVTVQAKVNGISHITGGGLEKNTMRLLAPGLGLEIDHQAWEVPTIFELIEKRGGVPVEDMRQTFNLGIGLVFVVPPAEAAQTLSLVKQQGFGAWDIGTVV